MLDFAPLQKHHYSYKLEGIDKNWVDAGTNNIATYTDIKYGEYKFLVKATNPDGIWSKINSISIVINPAWWMTWWFKALTVLFLIGIAISNLPLQGKSITCH